MKTIPPNEYRLTAADARRLKIPDELSSTDDLGMNGMFFIPCGREVLRCMVSDGEGWEHVSISLRTRCPTWGEMCFIKGCFWNEDECVIQYHPAKSEYVSCHPFCLHLWKPTGITIPIPPKIFVGI